MSILGLDVGTRTIGVALLEPSVGLATPRFTLPRKGVRQDVVALIDRLAGEAIDTLVVGLPVLEDGSEGDSARRARQVGEALAQATGWPLHYHDESFSTVEAEDRLRAAGHSTRRIKELVDAVAAAVILEDWLAER